MLKVRDSNVGSSIVRDITIGSSIVGGTTIGRSIVSYLSCRWTKIEKYFTILFVLYETLKYFSVLCGISKYFTVLCCTLKYFGVILKYFYIL
jgi:hypothetical protein